MKPSHQRLFMSVLSVSVKGGPAWMTLPKKTKIRLKKSLIKTMFITSFDSKGLIHKEFLPENTTLNSGACVEVLKRLLQRILSVRPVYAKQGSWTLIHYIVRPYEVLVVRQFLAAN
ncbi:mariner Mos1 transposase [Trichonephila clavipes]|nr:mariner Mos1 transposase [Trichonephila clavipes]